MESELLQIKINRKMAEIETLNAQMRELTLTLNGESEVECYIIEDEIIESEKELNSLKEQYANLLLLQEYQNSCEHIVVEDLIDLTPDKSETIYYCSRCLITINQK